MNIYAQNILDRYKEPFYKDKDFEPDLQHEEANHSCGDKIEVKLRTDGKKVTEYSFTGVGCAISQAAADMLGDLAEDQKLDEVLAITKNQLFEVLGIEISLRRSKCALLGLLAVQNGILIHQQKPIRNWTDFHL